MEIQLLGGYLELYLREKGRAWGIPSHLYFDIYKNFIHQAFITHQVLNFNYESQYGVFRNDPYQIALISSFV